MSKRSLYSLFLAFALLFAQQGAAWHALSHTNSTARHSQSDQKLPHGEQCTKCAAFSQIGAAFTSAAPALALAIFQDVPPQYVASQSYRFTLQAYQSRAPPFRV